MPKSAREHRMRMKLYRDGFGGCVTTGACIRNVMIALMLVVPLTVGLTCNLHPQGTTVFGKLHDHVSLTAMSCTVLITQNYLGGFGSTWHFTLKQLIFQSRKGG